MGKVCPMCQGNGRIEEPGLWMECPFCKGSGKVMVAMRPDSSLGLIRSSVVFEGFVSEELAAMTPDRSRVLQAIEAKWSRIRAKRREEEQEAHKQAMSKMISGHRAISLRLKYGRENDQLARAYIISCDYCLSDQPKVLVVYLPWGTTTKADSAAAAQTVYKWTKLGKLWACPDCAGDSSRVLEEEDVKGRHTGP